jgi:hypothetical protein
MATINPFQEPIDYSIDVKTPFEASLAGFKLGAEQATIRDAQQKRLLEQQAMQQTQARQAELGTRLKSFYDKKPEERNFEEIEQLFAFAGNKDQLDALKLMAEGTDKRRLDADKRFYAQVMLGLESEPTVAFKLLDDKILAEKDPAQKAALETIKRTAQTVNPAAAVNLIEPYTASIFGKDWYAGLKDARVERRAQDLAPSELKQKMADADKAVADAISAQAKAKNAPEREAADAARATADAKKAQVDANFAQVKIEADLKQAAATLRKTEADILIDKENTRIAALNAAAAKETNNLKRQELQQKIDDAKEKRDALDRDQKATVSNQSADIDNFLNTAQRVLNTPEDVIKSATGPVASRLPTLSSDVSDFEALVEALGSQAFIAQIPKIKGTGSLSEKEGDKLQASLQTLSLKQSPARLKENVTEAVRLLTKVRENIALKYGVQAPPIDIPSAAGVLVNLPNGQTLKFPNQTAADAFKKKAGI